MRLERKVSASLSKMSISPRRFDNIVSIWLYESVEEVMKLN